MTVLLALLDCRARAPRSGLGRAGTCEKVRVCELGVFLDNARPTKAATLRH
jgi:hypothetical protein